jgi:hypothetical protein
LFFFENEKEKENKNFFLFLPHLLGLPQQRHLFKSSLLVLSLSAIINNKEKKGKKRAPLSIILRLSVSLSPRS